MRSSRTFVSTIQGCATSARFTPEAVPIATTSKTFLLQLAVVGKLANHNSHNRGKSPPLAVNMHLMVSAQTIEPYNLINSNRGTFEACQLWAVLWQPLHNSHVGTETN